MEDKVAIVREKIHALFTDYSDDYDVIDYNRIQEDSKYVSRFLKEKGDNVEEAVKMLSETMKWRKENGINHIKRTDFPVEFFIIGELFCYVQDKNGVPTVFCRVELHRAVPEWKEVMKRFILYRIEEAEQLASEAGTGWGLVFDCRNGDIFNVELDLDYFGVKTLTTYYPQAFEYIMVYEIPFVLWAIFKLIESWLPEDYRKKFIFVKKAEILDRLGADNVPDFINGGTCETPYNFYHEDNLTAEEYAKKHDIKESAVCKLLTKYGKLIENGAKRCGRNRDGQALD